MTNHARSERRALADLLDEVGPDAPTLCEGWDTADLAAHLVLRERRPDAALGIAVPPAARYTERVQRSIRDARRWPALVDTVRNGPPLLLKPLDGPVNTMEYFIHHEDVRRARPGWRPRDLDEAEEAALWHRLALTARVLFRRSPVGVVIDSPGHGRVTAKAGSQEVTLTGPPSELLLFAFGRQDQARVDTAGPGDATERLRRARLGL
jgi:uncharacterized protein (TIGR03085 family)